MQSQPEFCSIETFVEYLLDEERVTFTFLDLQGLNFALQRPTAEIRRQLEGYGLKLETRPNEKRVRGFSTRSNDRHFGPGSSKSYGGSGHEQIGGWAGQEG